MDDEELLCRVARRDADAFRLLYARHSPAVYGVLCRLVGRTTDAAELLQETWLRGVRHLALYRGQSPFAVWLTGLALNAYRDWRRRHARDGSLEHGDARGVLRRGASERATVSQILVSLSIEQREVLVLHDIEGFTLPEIAAALEIEPGTVATRLSRARRTFRQRWDEVVT
jgi:RNA polymerase sigma-70 factor (ECF subfamily)